MWSESTATHQSLLVCPSHFTDQAGITLEMTVAGLPRPSWVSSPAVIQYINLALLFFSELMPKKHAKSGLCQTLLPKKNNGINLIQAFVVWDWSEPRHIHQAAQIEWDEVRMASTEEVTIVEWFTVNLPWTRPRPLRGRVLWDVLQCLRVDMATWYNLSAHNN